MKKSFFQFFSARESESCDDTVAEEKRGPAGTTQITVSVPVAESDWIRTYASRTHQYQPAVIAAAFERALHRRDVERPRYVEPGTSFTQRGVVELDLLRVP